MQPLSRSKSFSLFCFAHSNSSSWALYQPNIRTSWCTLISLQLHRGSQRWASSQKEVELPATGDGRTTAAWRHDSSPANRKKNAETLPPRGRCRSLNERILDENLCFVLAADEEKKTKIHQNIGDERQNEKTTDNHHQRGRINQFTTNQRSDI